MSEYQYCEFVALDGPISDEGLRYAEGCSSRADVSRVRWRNVCNFGDFHGSVETLLRYYDVHFYIENWDTVRFALAFPEGCLDQDAIDDYLRTNEPYEEKLSVKNTDGRLIVHWNRNEEGGWGWIEGGEGILDRLISIREDLMRGDYRELILGWLADILPEEWGEARDSGVLLPPIPLGLECLSPALQTLLEHFPVDPDALKVATRQNQEAMPKPIPISEVPDHLSVSEMKTFLERVANGDGSRVMSELNRLAYPKRVSPAQRTISCVDFATDTIEVRKARLEDEAKAEAADRERAAAARRKHLESVMKDADEIWVRRDELVDEKTAFAYDDAAKQFKDLCDAYRQAERDAEFQDRLTIFRKNYARRPAMMRRIKNL